MRQSLVSWFACPGILHRQRAAEFESELEKSEDIVIRTRLLGYYTALKKPTEADVDRQLEHLKVLISLVPEESFLAMPLDPSSAKYALIATEWRDQARAHGDSAEVISNAALFLARSDLDEACRLLENAIHLEPHVWTWRFHLGRILQQGAERTHDPSEKRLLSGEALAALNEALPGAPDTEAPYIHALLAEAALFGGDRVTAASHARKAIDTADAADWARGLTLHMAHTCLGILAFDEGDQPRALDHLAKSLSVPESPQFCVRGPVRGLLQRLSASGESALVEGYLAEWHSRFGLPDGWSL